MRNPRDSSTSCKKTAGTQHRAGQGLLVSSRTWQSRRLPLSCRLRQGAARCQARFIQHPQDQLISKIQIFPSPSPTLFPGLVPPGDCALHLFTSLPCSAKA